LLLYSLHNIVNVDKNFFAWYNIGEIMYFSSSNM